MQKEHLVISERLEGAESGLTGQQATAGRMTEVLNSLGHVLARETPPQEAAPVSPHPTSVSVLSLGTDHDGVETEVEVNLNPPAPPSPIETQPVPVGVANPMMAEEVEGAVERVELHADTPSTPQD